MNELNNIDRLIAGKFENFAPPPPSRIWANVQSNLEVGRFDQQIQNKFADYSATPSDAVWQHISTQVPSNLVMRRTLQYLSAVAGALLIGITLNFLYSSFNSNTENENNGTTDGSSAVSSVATSDSHVSNVENDPILNTNVNQYRTFLSNEINALFLGYPKSNAPKQTGKVVAYQQNTVKNDKNIIAELNARLTALQQQVNQAENQEKALGAAYIPMNAKEVNIEQLTPETQVMIATLKDAGEKNVAPTSASNQKVETSTKKWGIFKFRKRKP